MCGFRNVEKDLLKKFNVTLKPDKPKHPDYSDIITKAQSLLAKEFDVVFCLIDMDYINADNVRNISIDINNPHTSYSRVFEVFEELLQKR